MLVFVAGGSGAVGRRLVPQLIGAGYEVAAMTRDEGRAAWLREVGAQPIVADALDRTAVVDALTRTAPEVVIHQLTGLSRVKSFRNFDDEFALTNRLRTEAPTICSKARGPWAYAGSWRRATATGTTSEAATT